MVSLRESPNGLTKQSQLTHKHEIATLPLRGARNEMNMKIMDDQKLHVAILFGGRSGEHEVSLMSARSVLSVLDGDKYEVTQIGIT